MRLIKYDHSCFAVEEQGEKIIVDPGNYGELPDNIDNAVALIITHEHADHFSPENIAKIKAENTGVQIFASEEVAAQIEGAIAPEKRKVYEVGSFKLEFFGDMHAQIHPDYPGTHNLSVLINDAVYHPGDSLHIPPKPVKVLMCPITAPWQKASEAMDFVVAIKAEVVIPEHDAIISDEYGKPLYDRLVGGAVQSYGGEYQRLQTGETIDI